MHSTSSPRPWGGEDIFAQNEKVTVKLLYVKKGEAASLQYHNHRAEFWKVISGNPELTIGDEIVKASPGEEFSIEVGVKHRIAAPEGDTTLLEVSRGDFDEEDVVRLEDKYGRV